MKTITEIINEAWLAGYKEGYKTDYQKPEKAKKNMANNYTTDVVNKNDLLPDIMPSAFEKLTDKELEEAEHRKLSEIAELHKQWKVILNEQFYRKHPECKPH